MKRIVLVGGDERALRMAALLGRDGYEVQTLGLQNQDEKEARIGEADALLFPYPYSVRGDCVPTLTGLTLHPADVLEAARDHALLITGGGFNATLEAALKLGKNFQNKWYTQHEPFVQMNAELSAEAAVYETMRVTTEALLSMTVMVLGYGRFGREIAKRLHALGTTVWVGARSQQQRMLANGDGMHAFALEELETVAPFVRIVLNTVPAQVLKNEVLKALNKNTYLLELASAPYGFDRELAESLKLNYEVLPSLPARYAPETAARALKLAADRLLWEAFQ
ncbi:MAG: dipicolinate synthase subunit DpsA [Clostridia bacterium]